MLLPICPCEHPFPPLVQQRHNTRVQLRQVDSQQRIHHLWISLALCNRLQQLHQKGSLLLSSAAAAPGCDHLAQLGRQIPQPKRRVLIVLFFQHLGHLLTRGLELRIQKVLVALQHSWLLPTGALQQLLDQGQVCL